ncbi:DUF4105 domain-containing protein [Chelatococcus daeguensis]|uniref:Lnb N-terminal periplasmic domain-containing protein n=1 Tax=Chelatococcus TaxID=28209 RepID=UPI0007AB407D|nr:MULTISPECIES: DUF4105 domain-containing protein [Chelatococcus]KZE29250.1 hypothetical protein AVW15_05470 [Chelatococcus daeguensis]MBM3083970.1 DUF4105 domain-containing protein [Chelatococcus daeguensis]
MARLTGILARVAIGAAVLLVSVWAALALWYRLSLPEEARLLAAGAFGLLGLATIVALVRRRAAAASLFALAVAGVFVWWTSIVPPADADWSPDVARQVTGTVDGSVLSLTGVRNFDWRGEDDFTPAWETRRYDLDQLRTLDMFMSYWAGPSMAHMILSFGFADGRYLAWSVEVRRRRGGGFSPIADLFKSNTLVLVAAEERDVIGVRTNIRGEDVQRYRLDIPQEMIRALLLQYVADANALATRPTFYNSLTSNCTTTVVRMARALGDVLPADWRLIVNGYLPEYAYDMGALDSSRPMAELRAEARISPRALAAGLTSSFSQDIRQP